MNAWRMVSARSITSEQEPKTVTEAYEVTSMRQAANTGATLTEHNITTQNVSCDQSEETENNNNESDTSSSEEEEGDVSNVNIAGETHQSPAQGSRVLIQWS